MNCLITSKRFFYFCACLLICSSQTLADPVASLYSAEGSIEGRINSKWINVTAGQNFESQDALKTNEKSTAGIKFSDGFLIRLKEKTSIEFAQGKTTQPINLNSGTAYFFSRKPERFPEIHTPQVSASVRGTEFVVEVSTNETKISVIQGAVDASNQYGSVSLSPGEVAVTKTGNAPVKQILVNPLDAVQWSLYYPAVFSLGDFTEFLKSANQGGIAELNNAEYKNALTFFSGSAWHDKMGRSLALYYLGKPALALDEIKHLQDNNSDLLVYKSSLLLSLGAVEDASDILESLGKNNESANVLAQKALVDLVANRKNQGTQKINRALAINNSSPASLLVSSYLNQANFNLEAAKSDVKKILDAHPQDVLAQSRYAEILLGFGEIEEADQMAKEAVNKMPNNDNALTTLGFVALSRYQGEEALKYFNQALSFNDTSASAHLGKGLASIRNGNLANGREEMEIATQLAPNISLYRSYLGKAFFEEEKQDLSEKEYEQAMRLDSNDPTPYLYRSFLRLSQHRPVEALSDIESSIEKNDNRAVYRSKLLLDQDEAVRGTSLGKIYNRVGFSELARVEAIKSLNHDYANYSAHFLLSDLYQSTNLNSNAQVTENLIGRLLVPVNYNSNAVDLVGSQASFNEYTALFTRPVSRTRVTGGVNSATQDYVGGVDQTVSGNTASFRLGYLGETKDGFRSNDFQRQNQIYTQGQYQLFENDTIVWDAAGVKNNQGDVEVNTDPYAENKSLNTSLDSSLIRAGYHHTFSLNSHLIAQAFYNHGSFKKNNLQESSRISGFNITDSGATLNSVPFSFDGRTGEYIKTRDNFFRGDIQHIYDNELFSLVSGVSIRNQRLNNSENGYISDVGSRDVLSFLNGYQLSSAANVNQNSERAYIYSKWRLLESLTLDGGLTYTHLELAENPDIVPFTSATVNRESWDPKFGAVFQLMDNLSMRATYAKTLGRTERGGIGPLEPTFVGGFNQLIDGIRGSAQDLYAIGLDAKNPSTKSYFGTSFQNRKISLNRPFTTSNLSIESGTLTTSTTLQEGIFSNDADEDRVSTYLYQILGSRFSATGNHDWENFKQGISQPDFITNRFALGLRYFDPSGFFAFGRNTLRDQRISGSGVDSSSDYSSITDLGLGYEFDSFHGFSTLEFKNIFDQDFKYSAIRDEEFLLPKFGAVLRFSYNF